MLEGRDGRLGIVESLYEAYKNRVYSLCVKLTGSRSGAEDLFCETWMKIIEKHRNLKSDKDPANWIYTVCLNLYRKSYAKSKRLPMSARDHESVLREIHTDENLEARVAASEETAKLRAAISKLDDKYRVPLILFYFREDSYKDIADVMKLPMSTVKYRIHRAKKLLRSEMEGES